MHCEALADETLQYDDRLSNTVKELNTLETQLSKDSKKLDSASDKKVSAAQQKVTETQRAIDETNTFWLREATQAFPVYQRADQERLETLKQVVTQFETANSDAAGQLMSITEKTMQICLNFDVEAEMTEFALKEGSAGAVVARSAAPPSRPQRSASNATQRTTNTTGASRRADMPPPPLPAPRTSAAGIAPSASQTTLPASATSNTISASPAAVPENSSSASIHSFDQSSQRRGVVGTPSLPDTPASNKTSGGSSAFKSAFGRFGRSSKGGNTALKSVPSQEGSGKDPNSYGALGDGDDVRDDTIRRPPPPPRARGSSGGGGGLDMMDDDTPLADVAAAAAASSGGAPRLQDPLSPSKRGNEQSLSDSLGLNGSSKAPQVDAEGYSIPPPDRKPWDVVGGRADDEEDDEEGGDIVSNL